MSGSVHNAGGEVPVSKAEVFCAPGVAVDTMGSVMVANSLGVGEDGSSAVRSADELQEPRQTAPLAEGGAADLADVADDERLRGTGYVEVPHVSAEDWQVPVGMTDAEKRDAWENASVGLDLRALRRIAATLVGASDVDDLVQDALMLSFTNIHRFRPGTDFRSWTFTILRNRSKNFWRHQSTRVPVDSLDEMVDSNYHGVVPGAQEIGGGSLIGSQSAENIVLEQELEGPVTDAMKTINPLHLRILELVEGQGVSYNEAATALGVKYGTVASGLSRAKRALSDALSGIGHGSGRPPDAIY